VPVIRFPHEYTENDLYVDLRATLGLPVHLKCEGFNFAGSIKLKAALEMIDTAERSGCLRPGSVLIESSSGNLGVALAMIAASRGYPFECVIDVRSNLAARQMIEALGGRVHLVTDPDPVRGLLGARIDYVQARVREDPRYVWLNQYANPANWLAHHRHTAPAIAGRFPDLDVLFVGAGTTGTLMGCARYLRRARPEVTVVAVDAVGSVTFGGPAGTRLIPGLGTGVRPSLVNESFVDDVVLVEEIDTVRSCRRLAAHGFVFGGSTGTVVHGAAEWLRANRAGRDCTAVALAPDMGERYLDSMYRPAWVDGVYGAHALDDLDAAGSEDADTRTGRPG
jgi:2,3-diaminopropionate biosynthesis protein SbnA